MEAEFKYIFWNQLLTESEIDLINVLINIVDRHDDFDKTHPFSYDNLSFMIDTNMHELCSSLGFVELDTKHIIDTLDSINQKSASVHYMHGNTRFLEKGIFVHRYIITTTKFDLNKRLKIWINSSLVKILREHKQLFAQFYRHTAYELRSKYTRIMYDALSAKHTVHLKLEEQTINDLFDYDLFEYEFDSWSKFSSNILKRVAFELNDKSNMQLEFEPIKTKVNDRKQTIGFKLTAYNKADGLKEYFDNEFLMERKINYYMERDIIRRVDTQKRLQNKIENEELYKNKIRKELNKNREEYAARVSLQEWINLIKYHNADHSGIVVLRDFSKNNHYIAVNNNYKLYDIDKKTELSTSARDTKIKIQKFLEMEGTYEIVEVAVEKLKNCSISFTDG